MILPLIVLICGLAVQRPAFDAASIKPNKSVGVGGASMDWGRPGGRVFIRKFTLRMLLGLAYNLPSFERRIPFYRRSAGLGRFEYFDIEATTGAGADVAAKRLMLQALLADRFKLRIHQERRQRGVYALVMVKPGKLGTLIRVHDAEAGCGVNNPCGEIVSGRQPAEPNPIWAAGKKMTMTMIAEAIGGMEDFDRPIIDGTGDSRYFDFRIEWNTHLHRLSANAQPDLPGVSFVDALRDQLGLKLVTKTASADMWVIDHVERPSAN